MIFGPIRLLPNTPSDMLIENHSWKWPCVCWCGFSCTKECKVLMLVIPFWVNWASAVNRMLCRICGYGCRLHKIVHGWRDHLVKGVVLVEGDIDRIHHGANISISMSVLHQSSCKFCVYWYLGFFTLLPERHLLHVVVVHILHSPVIL